MTQPTPQRTALAAVTRAMLVICVPIILIVSPLYLYVTSAFVEMQYQLPYVNESTRFDLPERERLSDTLIGYLRHSASENDMATLLTDDGQLAMRPAEVSHMADVRDVMDGFFTAHLVALVVLAGLVTLALHLGLERPLADGLSAGVWLVLGLMGTILVAVIVDFDGFFTLFHKLFFVDDTWLFYIEDTLIQLYPLGFWIGAVTWVALTIVVEGVLVLSLAGRMRRHAERSVD